MPMLWAPANPKIGEREVLAAMLEIDAGLVANRTGVPLISDKGFAGKAFEKELAGQGVQLLRPSRKRETARQLIESVNDTLKDQLYLDQHGGRTSDGVAIRLPSAASPRWPPPSGTPARPNPRPPDP
ncbi:hypothetical protein [Streptomyces sp. STR69]|uniref:hypothetical protein n=1 Tax=Streptomyces sp. STR69 TaxID=1796942 RepID=UPI0021C88D8D|nr:hypothetical protein [Streptomyces sp. STR69]